MKHYGFITVFARTCHFLLFSNSNSFNPILILFSHLRIGLPTGVSPATNKTDCIKKWHTGKCEAVEQDNKIKRVIKHILSNRSVEIGVKVLVPTAARISARCS